MKLGLRSYSSLASGGACGGGDGGWCGALLCSCGGCPCGGSCGGTKSAFPSTNSRFLPVTFLDVLIELRDRVKITLICKGEKLDLLS